MCGAGDWDALEDFCRRFDELGWQIREWNSPLYSGKVYASLVIGAAISKRPVIVETVRRWTALLALQNVWVLRRPRPRKMDFGGEPRLQRFGTGTPLWMPPTGIRANALSGSTASPVLAVVLGCPWWPNPKFDPDRVPRDRSEWTDRDGARLFATLAYAVREAIKSHGNPLSAEVAARCRPMVREGLGPKALVDVLGDMRLHRGLKRFLIERGEGDVLTAWEGFSPTTQKPGIPAARIVDGDIEVAAPSLFKGSGATKAKSSIGDRAIKTTGDVERRLERLPSPSWIVTLYRDRAPEFEAA